MSTNGTGSTLLLARKSLPPTGHMPGTNDTSAQLCILIISGTNHIVAILHFVHKVR